MSIMSVAETLNQLAGVDDQGNMGVGRLVATIGAKNFGYSADKNYVSFRFMRGARNKANYIKITLTSMDLYDIEFGYIRGVNFTVVGEHFGLYSDMLKSTFEEETGLLLKPF